MEVKEQGCWPKNWQQYVEEVRKPEIGCAEERLYLLDTVQGWLSKVDSFKCLMVEQRKAIAGTLIREDEMQGEDINQFWKLFGSMTGAGYFNHIVIENYCDIAAAIDNIPEKGEVKKEHFQQFCDSFKKAFEVLRQKKKEKGENLDREGTIKSASRLLAMKRPDVFFCITRQNEEKAAKAMGY